MLEKLREFLRDNNVDYLLVNTTDEFLVEYNVLSNCARYFVTGFTGSTGDALVSCDSVWQFVDGRYHEQADAEVEYKTVQVVKLQLGQSYLDELVRKIPTGKTLGIVSKKISLSFYKALHSKLTKKHCKIKVFDFEPVENFQHFKVDGAGENVKQIDIKIAGIDADTKFEKIVKKMRLKESCAYIETNLENIAYLTNCRQYKTPFSSTFKAKMVLYRDKAVIFSNEIFDSEIGKNFKISPLSEFDYAFNQIQTVMYNPATINYYDFNLVKSRAKELQFDFIKEMKSIKNKAEIEHFKKNFARTDNVVNKTAFWIQKKSDLTEKLLSDMVEEEYLRQGARQLSFRTILASGINSSIIHYSHPSEVLEIKDGDFVLLDCGGHFEGGYSTDITRTFVKGEASALQKKVYTTVLKMFLNAYHYKVTSRTTGYTLDRVARKIHKQSGLKDFNFNHGLGHGVGINVHENPPTISCGALGRRVLKKNMIFTIEPGLYKTGFGGVRLENTVILTENNGSLKIESLSHVPFQESVIDYNLLNEQEKIWLKDWQAKAKEGYND